MRCELCAAVSEIYSRALLAHITLVRLLAALGIAGAADITAI